MIALIGGSGLGRLPGLEISGRLHLETRWGVPSAPLTEGLLDGVPVLFLPRHGSPHAIAPHRINYRANLWALREAGAHAVVAVAATGGIAPDCHPGALVIPDQLIDYSWGRSSTFHEGEDDEVVHIDFTQPYDARLRADLIEAAHVMGEGVIESGVYACTQGPRLETAAEIRRLARDGCTIVGMTGMPEAALARELGLPYACLSVVANYAAGVDPAGGEITLEAIHQHLERGLQAVQRFLPRALHSIHDRLSVRD